MLNQNFLFDVALAVNSTDVLLLFQRVYDALYASDGLSCLFYKLGLLNRRGLFIKSNTEVLPKCQFGTLGLYSGTLEFYNSSVLKAVNPS